ncbi:selenium-binding protein [Trifolium repens]|nr:selenium-binding protein [Trifolium repens]
MISTSWGASCCFHQRPWSVRVYIPLEARFLHDPSKDTGFVGCALASNMVRFFKNQDESMEGQFQKGSSIVVITDGNTCQSDVPYIQNYVLLQNYGSWLS